MHELISSPGLRFELLELRGLLTYTLKRSGKPVRQYVLSDSDIEDVCEDEDGDNQKPRTKNTKPEVSAVGIRLRIIKNDGLLEMGFQGTDGDSAKWTFEGVDLEHGSLAVASATTQTLSDPGNCAACGRKLIAKEEKLDCGTQTSHPVTKNTGTQLSTKKKVTVIPTANTGVQVNIKAAVTDVIASGSDGAEVDTSSAPPEMANTTVETSTTTEPNTSNSAHLGTVAPGTNDQTLKRKVSVDLQAKLIHKYAKSKHDSEPWPDRILMDCWREKPVSKGDLGKLIIDLKKATVSYESTYGRGYAQTTECKRVDIRATDTKVVYHALDPKDALPAHRGWDGATALLEIVRISASGNKTTLLSVHCHAPEWRTWHLSANTPPTKVYISDPEIVVDALVHCIDRVSKRQAVHNPDADHSLTNDAIKFARPPAFRGGMGRYVDAEWTAAEQEGRKRAKMKAKVYQPEKFWHEVEIPY
ncbi:hypothetical protein E8E13_010098 [Curvularia kusanoi]|uniref:Uncharacterized protein n=1 Tax=Curvularia kusanoi TaxID=90978 RepID=A0A9P4THK7_CURKU|nr:hypothetical protein E8E13_010098 [Curvularia kusanoi]